MKKQFLAILTIAISPAFAEAQSLFCKYDTERGIQTVIVNFDDSAKAVSMGGNAPLVSVNAKCLQPGQNRTTKQCVEYSLTAETIRGDLWGGDNIGPDMAFQISRVDGSFLLRTNIGRLIGKGSCVVNKTAF